MPASLKRIKEDMEKHITRTRHQAAYDPATDSLSFCV
jgi:hypothetical protein